MHYLIDGHNLIGHMREIDLADPDDEAKLVEILHRFVLRHPRHRITVVFDGGGNGYLAPVKRDRVEVTFAHSPGDADSRLIQILQRLASPASYTLVSADRAIVAAARERGVAVKAPADFAQDLAASRSKGRTPPRRVRPEPKMPPVEVEAWLELFGSRQDRV